MGERSNDSESGGNDAAAAGGEAAALFEFGDQLLVRRRRAPPGNCLHQPGSSVSCVDASRLAFVSAPVLRDAAGRCLVKERPSIASLRVHLRRRDGRRARCTRWTSSRERSLLRVSCWQLTLNSNSDSNNVNAVDKSATAGHRSTETVKAAMQVTHSVERCGLGDLRFASPKSPCALDLHVPAQALLAATHAMTLFEDEAQCKASKTAKRWWCEHATDHGRRLCVCACTLPRLDDTESALGGLLLAACCETRGSLLTDLTSRARSFVFCSADKRCGVYIGVAGALPSMLRRAVRLESGRSVEQPSSICLHAPFTSASLSSSPRTHSESIRARCTHGNMLLEA